MKKEFLLIIALFIGGITVSANVTLPKIFSNNMVLQANTMIPVWGWADANEKVEVRFHRQLKTTKADKTGKWMVRLDAETAGGPYELSVKGNKVALFCENVENPIAVHFSWTGNASESNLFNKEGFPAVPFRTDDWKTVTKDEKYKIEKLNSQTTSEKKMITLPAELVVDKIRGGMLGMMIGNMNGWPYEFKNYEKHGDVNAYIPYLPEGAQTDDDTDFEWVYIYNMQKTRNVYLPYNDIGTYWKSSINDGIWCANRYARYLMDLGIQPPMTGSVVLNPWAEFNVSGQFLCESFGLLAPAMPQTAAKIGLHYTRVAIDNEPAQTTQLYTTMISTALAESDINKILDAGVASLDPKSIMVHIIEDVRKWHSQNPDNPAETHRLLHEKYKLKDELTRNRNGSELNTAANIASILYGNGNFSETIRHSMNFGYDADCNCATLGTLMGTMYGYRRILNEGWQIVDRYKNTKRDNMPMDETIISFADRIVDVFEIVNQENGGSKTVINKTVVYNIPSEKPASVYKLLTFEEEKATLKNEVEKDIESNLLSGKKQEMARAAYLAVSLDLTKEMMEKYPKQWKEACYDLSGYWKVISNIFHSDSFKSLVQLREKFIAAGFIPMDTAPKTEAIYKDMETWKDPRNLYGTVK